PLTDLARSRRQEALVTSDMVGALPDHAASTSGEDEPQVDVHPVPEQPDGADDLTERQRKVLEAIRDWMRDHGYPPSVREIGTAVGLTSTSSVAYQLRVLERKGYLRKDPHRPRTVGVLVGGDTESAWAAQANPAYVP